MYYFTETFTFRFQVWKCTKLQIFKIFPLDKMIISRSNQETLKWLRQINLQKMNGETLTDEALCFFGELQTKRPNTVKSKIAEFVKKEDQFRKCVLFKIMRERGGVQKIHPVDSWTPTDACRPPRREIPLAPFNSLMLYPGCPSNLLRTWRR